MRYLAGIIPVHQPKLLSFTETSLWFWKLFIQIWHHCPLLRRRLVRIKRVVLQAIIVFKLQHTDETEIIFWKWINAMHVCNASTGEYKVQNIQPQENGEKAKVKVQVNTSNIVSELNYGPEDQLRQIWNHRNRWDLRSWWLWWYWNRAGYHIGLVFHNHGWTNSKSYIYLLYNSSHPFVIDIFYFLCYKIIL